MSHKLLKYVHSYMSQDVNTQEFVEKFFTQWRYERDNKELAKDSPKVSKVLSSIFCLIDLYNPEEDREDYELNEKMLKEKIKEVLALELAKCQ